MCTVTTVVLDTFIVDAMYKRVLVQVIAHTLTHVLVPLRYSMV